MRDVFLIECSGEKHAGETLTPARKLYTSERFLLARQLAEAASDAWFILSAKHGILSPSQLVDSYDRSLCQMSQDEQCKWSANACRTLLESCDVGDRITILCNDKYTTPLLASSLLDAFPLRLPLRGKSRAQRSQYLSDALATTKRSQDLDRLYHLLCRHDSLVIEGRHFGDPGFSEKIPEKGVYFFFEPGQTRMAHSSQRRVIRVGTHGVSAGSKSTLYDRISTHFGTRSGGGNHRSSIMRLHIGSALLSRGALGYDAPSWASKTKPKGQHLALEIQLENDVSRYIRDMTLICISIGDKSSAKSDRAFIEQNAIALLAGSPSGPIDVADSHWLGAYSPKREIRTSGLWNVDGVNGTFRPDFLDTLEYYVDVTTGAQPMPNDSIAIDNGCDHGSPRNSAGRLESGEVERR